VAVVICLHLLFSPEDFSCEILSFFDSSFLSFWYYMFSEQHGLWHLHAFDGHFACL